MTKEDRLAVLALIDEVVVQLAMDEHTSAIVMDKLGEAQALLEQEYVEEFEEDDEYDDPESYEEY